MRNVETIDVDVTVELGAASLPIHQLLRMGRGAVIELDTTEADAMRIYANRTLVAHGDIRIDDGRVMVEITGRVERTA